MSEKPVKETSKKVGRKPIYSNKIKDEDFNNMDEGITTPAEVAKERNIPVQTVHNQQHKRKKLKLRFQNRDADDNLTSKQTLQGQSFQDIQSTPQMQDNGIPLDATEAIKGMFQFVDLGLQMSSTLTKGRIEYEKCSDEELNNMAKVTNQSPFARKVASQEGLSALIIAGTVIGTFGKHIKYHPALKHKPNDENCQCDKCKTKQKELEVIEKLAETNKIETNKEINDVPPTPKKTPEEVIEQNTKPDPKKLQVEKRANEIKQQVKEDSRDVLKDTFVASPEYQLPEVD